MSLRVFRVSFENVSSYITRGYITAYVSQCIDENANIGGRFPLPRVMFFC